MKIGDLVRSNKQDEKVGVIVDIFGDLNPEDPWVRVRWTTPAHSFEWCKQQGLSVLSESQMKES
tara:strand:+ start:1276 stop:1467 length:192 start_codon:yes stop_codon:yes gene_type:complete